NQRNHKGKPLYKCKCTCGTIKLIDSSNLKSETQSCGCIRRVPVGHKIKRKDGYVYLKIKHENRMGGLGNYDFEHIVVMERHLGRSLYADETVHHINGNRSDNRIENLELWSTAHPYGQRVRDLIAWAKTILERYSQSSDSSVT